MMTDYLEFFCASPGGAVCDSTIVQDIKQIC